MSQIIYEASVYSREVSYRNFNGEDKVQVLHFALDPLQLMQIIAGFIPKKVKSGNPALQGSSAPVDESQQLKMVRDLAVQSAGSPSEDGESWTPFTEFSDSLVGKAFLTKLASSDGDRREFSEKVILAPFRAFVGYATSDESNTDKDKQQFAVYLQQMENIFTVPDQPEETLEARRVRLEAELAEMAKNPQDGTVTALPVQPSV